MRTVILWLVAVAIAACGPSSGNIKTAKQARYKGDQLQLLAATKAAIASKFELEKVDETSLGMETILRWYNPDGLLASERSDDVRDIPDRAISLKLVVTLLADGDAFVVRVKPLMMRRFKGRPNPDVLTENDPSVPEWMLSKLDLVSVDIHNALAPYEVKSPGGAMPANPGVSPPPDEPGSNKPGAPPPVVDPAATGSAAQP